MYVALGGNLKTHIDGDVGWVEGHGVLFGSIEQRDLDKQFFTADTDYGHARGDNADATLNHGIPMITKHTKAGDLPHLVAAAQKRFKSPIKTETIDTGILARHALDLKDEYERWVFEQTEKGTFKWSSGALGHLLNTDPDTGEIKRWIIGEFAYTPTPAEPRIGAITPLKSYQAAFEADVKNLAEVQPSPEASIDLARQPESDATVSVPQQVETKTIAKEIIMSDQDETQDAVVADNSAATLEAIKALTAKIERLEKAPKVELGVATAEGTKAFNIVDADSMGSDAYTKGLHAYIKSRGKNKSIKALEAGVDSEGGYLVDEEWEASIAKMRESVSAVRRLPISRRSTTSPIYRWPTESTAYTAATSTAEEVAYDQTDPAFGESTFTIEKYTRLTLVSEELFNDSIVNIQAELTEMLGRAHGLAENATLVTRLEAATLTSLTLDGNAAITAAEVPEMYYLLPDGYDFNGWLMRKATEGVIRGLTGSDFHFMPNPQGNGMNLWGAPVVTASAVAAIGTTANSVFSGDWTAGVGFVERSGLSISINPYLYEANGQVGIFSRSRWDIQVLQGLAIVEGVHPV